MGKNKEISWYCGKCNKVIRKTIISTDFIHTIYEEDVAKYIRDHCDVYHHPYIDIRGYF